MAQGERVDTLIIGAGLIGSSVAMHLAQLGVKNIRVVDFDLEGSLSSSELNAGGVRATMTQPINIQCSKTSIEYMATHAAEVGYRPCGYLWMRTAEQLETALKARKTQIEQGWPVEVLDVPGLKAKVPFINKTDGIAGAIFGPKDGLVNPNLLKNHFRNQARASGVKFDDRTLLRKAERSATGYTLTCEKLSGGFSIERKQAVLTSDKFTPPNQQSNWGSEKVIYQADRVVNCAGPWAPTVAEILAYPCPSKPLRRQVCIFDCRTVDLTPYGMMVDTSGVYFHPEATNGLAGIAQPEPFGLNYQYDGESFFMEHIWPALYERSTEFEALKHITGWAGLYEVSPDETSIIGPVEYGDAGKSERVFEAHSFSGHGAMHSYAAGLLLAEKMVKGRYETWDGTVLSATRFEKGRELHEGLVI